MTTGDESRDAQRADDWLTIEEASEAYGVSAKTIRRRATAGKLEAVKEYDEAVGGERWLIKPPEASRAALVPIEILEKIEDAYRKVAEATARAEVAERTLEFERERRQALEDEKKAATDAAERLRAELEAERARRWWQRR